VNVMAMKFQNERDSRFIKFVNGHGAVEIGHVAQRFAFDESTARRRFRKLIEADLLARIDLAVFNVKPIVATQLGCTLANDDLAPLVGIRIATWEHDRSLVKLAPILEQKFRGRFEPSRRIRHRLPHLKHLPDGYIWTPGKGRPVAVELELTAKSPLRVAKIIGGYRADLSVRGVLYVAGSPSICRLIERFTNGDPLFRVILRDQLVRTDDPSTAIKRSTAGQKER
jgi:hypothetical protein